jgi:hypothetical protein
MTSFTIKKESIIKIGSFFCWSDLSYIKVMLKKAL